jgi:hypothetical protein
LIGSAHHDPLNERSYTLLRFRRYLGDIVGSLLVLSGIAHSFAGWPAMRRTFAATNAPASIIDGLAVPWHFTGAAMGAFGVLAIVAWHREVAAADPFARVMRVAIGAVYIGFALWAFVFVKLDPTFLMFLVPGLLLVAIRPPRATERSSTT